MKRYSRFFWILLGIGILIFPVHPNSNQPPTVSRNFYEKVISPRSHEVLEASQETIPGRHYADIMVPVFSGFQGRSIVGISASFGHYELRTLGTTTVPDWLPCDYDGKVWITEKNFDAVMRQIKYVKQVGGGK